MFWFIISKPKAILILVIMGGGVFFYITNVQNQFIIFKPKK